MTDRRTWLRVPDEAELPPEVLELFKPSREKLGFVPNVLRCYSLRPSRLLAWNAHRDSGWTDEDVMDITEVTALFNFSNRMASGLGWQANPEYESLGR
jgi:hypothetical protein